IANHLYKTPTARQLLIEDAKASSEEGKVDSDALEQERKRLDTLGLPVGWSGEVVSLDVLHHIPGWLITALAATLGAPFWFDVLNRLMVIRSTVKPYEKSGAEASQERPYVPPAPAAATTTAVADATPEASLFVPHEWAGGAAQEGVL